jgi:hypothetical protein
MIFELQTGKMKISYYHLSILFLSAAAVALGIIFVGLYFYLSLELPDISALKHYRQAVLFEPGSPMSVRVRVRMAQLIMDSSPEEALLLLEEARMLEPEAPDSFFNWNFFDTILQRKEGFSPYVFEDLAAEILKKDPELQKEFDKKKREDPGFAKNWYAQLNYIYKKSKYLEKAWMQYPVYRILR